MHRTIDSLVRLLGGLTGAESQDKNNFTARELSGEVSVIKVGLYPVRERPDEAIGSGIRKSGRGNGPTGDGPRLGNYIWMKGL